MVSGRPLKVLLKTPFSMYSGYGNDGFGLLRALYEWGCDVYPQPVWLDVPIPRDLAHLFCKTLHGPFDLTINHWDPAHLFITRNARAMARVAVAWTMWEFDSGPGPWPDDWPGEHAGEPGPVPGLVPHCENLENPQPKAKPGQELDAALDRGTGEHSGLRDRLQWFDLVLGYDEVSLRALSSYIPGHVHGSVLQGGYASRDWKRVERDWTDPDRFQFIMHGQLNARKCPWTAIQAFQQLKFEKPGPWPEGFDGATMALHTSAPGEIFPELNVPFEKQRLKVFVDAFDKATMDEFYNQGHCLLAPSRGEGKNLPALEFMTTGGVVAATNYSGHTQWLNADYAYPLPYHMQASFGNFPWAAHDARVSIEDLKETMWHIYVNRNEAKVKADLAAEIIPKMCDWQVVLENLFRRIRDTITSNNVGPQVYDIAMACRIDQEGDLKAGLLRA